MLFGEKVRATAGLRVHQRDLYGLSLLLPPGEAGLLCGGFADQLGLARKQGYRGDQGNKRARQRNGCELEPPAQRSSFGLTVRIQRPIVSVRRKHTRSMTFAMEFIRIRLSF